MNRLHVWLREQLRSFSRDRRGNIAITFALAVIPVIGCVGAAIDYSRANAVKASLQTALDSTALMLSKDAATLSDVDSDGTGSDLDRKAKTYFMSMFTRSDATNIKVTASFSDNGGSSVMVNASADVPTSIMEALGFDKIGIGASSTAKWGTERLRVALVLDVTGSMSSAGKMDALKEATDSLLTQLQSAATKDDDVYVSIIPFNKDVNVGKDNYDADWIDWTEWDENWQNNNGKCNPTRDDHGNKIKTKRACDRADGEWTPDPISNAHQDQWNGCITDRGNESGPSADNYDQKVVAPDQNIRASLFAAEQFDDCPVAMLGLTNDWTKMKELVQSMQPVGNTNQPIGLVWGWQSLVGGGPLTVPAKETGYKYKEIIILLSDGMNTENRWSGRQSEVDNRMLDGSGNGTCANIKNTSVTIYTLQVNTGHDPTSTLLQKCASDTGKFFLVTKASDIAGAFDAIADEITKLRVAR
jgi:Flp pilus assembly protein TadG